MTRSKALSAVLAVIFALIFASAGSAEVTVTPPSNTDATFFIVTDTLANGTVNQSYTQRLRATVSGVSWVVAGGALPDGLTLNPNTGEISGTPTKASNYQFMISASNGSWADSRAFAITIGEEVIPVKITRESLNPGTVNQPYADVITANVTGVTFTRQSGSLPNGLTMDDAGVITGTPTATGTSRFIVSATNGETSDVKEFTITIANDPIVIRTNILPNGTVNREYSAELIANKTSGVTWSIATGSSLPRGLTLAPSTGRITGTPTATGIYEVRVNATDGTTTASRTYSIQITAPDTVTVYVEGVPQQETFRITTPTRLPDGTVNTPYVGVRFAAEPSSLTNISWAISNNTAAAGLTLSDTGNLTGTPRAAGTYFFEVAATSGTDTTRETFRLTVNAVGGNLTITPISEIRATVGKEINNVQFTANISTGITWSVSGLPAGLTLNPNTGRFVGTPQVAGTYNLVVTATANGQTDTLTVPMIVAEDDGSGDGQDGAVINFTPSSISANRGEAMRAVTLVASINKTISSWVVENLPAGVTYSPTTGVISGTPDVAGDFVLNITITTSDGNSYTGRVTMNVRGSNDDDDSGCNSGFGILGLAALSLFARKGKK